MIIKNKTPEVTGLKSEIRVLGGLFAFSVCLIVR